jgi:V8-like Glu-specific endopeptidase
MHLRKRGMRILLAVLAAGALTASGLGATAAVAAPAPQADPNATVVHQAKRGPTAVKAYWTPARLKSAKAIDEPINRVSPAAAPRQTNKLGPVSAAGAPGKVAAAKGTKATPSSVHLLDVNFSQIWTDHSTMPATSVGKLYFSTPFGDSECSASVINAPNFNVIWTAGHCTNDGAGGWYGNWLFVPDYFNGVWPLGSWAAQFAATPNGFLFGGNSDYDMAALRLWPDAGGTEVGWATGYQGYCFNCGYGPHVLSMGYPYDTHPPRPGITGQDLMYCDVATWQSGNQQDSFCDMGHGSSGGPWLSSFNGSWGYLVGNVSHGNGDPNDIQTWSPYLGDAAINVRNAVI